MWRKSRDGSNPLASAALDRQNAPAQALAVKAGKEFRHRNPIVAC